MLNFGNFSNFPTVFQIKNDKLNGNYITHISGDKIYFNYITIATHKKKNSVTRNDMKQTRGDIQNDFKYEIRKTLNIFYVGIIFWALYFNAIDEFFNVIDVEPHFFFFSIRTDRLHTYKI